MLTGTLEGMPLSMAKAHGPPKRSASVVVDALAEAVHRIPKGLVVMTGLGEFPEDLREQVLVEEVVDVPRGGGGRVLPDVVDDSSFAEAVHSFKSVSGGCVVDDVEPSVRKV